MTKIVLETPLSRGNCELKSWPNCMNQDGFYSISLPLSSGVHEFCYKKSPSMLVFCHIYCRDNIYNVSLFGNRLPSDSRPNKPNLYVYNLFGVIWCWFDWEQAISMCFHTFDRDEYMQMYVYNDLYTLYIVTWRISTLSYNFYVLKFKYIQVIHNLLFLMLSEGAGGKVYVKIQIYLGTT